MALGVNLLYGCSTKQQESFTRSIMFTHPTRLGSDQLKVFSGVVQEGKSINLGFKIPGQIEKVYVKEDDFVRQGQIIALLDNVDFKLEAEASQIQYNQLSDELARLKLLYEGNSLAVNDYEKAEAGLQQLRIQLQTNLNRLDYTQLLAPVSGYVQQVNFEAAEMVDAGVSVIKLLDVTNMEVKLDIPVEVFIQRENFSSITCRSAQGEELVMKLVSIAPKADGAQLYSMRLNFANGSDYDLSPGINTEVTIRLSNRFEEGMFKLPLHCIFKDQGRTFVWTVVSDSIVHKLEVSIHGIDDEDNSVIVIGLRGDEKVVKAGVNALLDNEKVKVIGQSSETNVGGVI